jgi:hypothetical protein
LIGPQSAHDLIDRSVVPRTSDKAVRKVELALESATQEE